MKTVIFVRRFIAFLFLMSMSTLACAFEEGSVSSNLLTVFSGLGSMFSGICLVVGIGMIFASYVQYRQHRINKLLVPVSKPIFMFILGVLLCCIPLLGQYTEGGKLVAHQVSS